MINKVRLIETPKHAFNYLSDYSRNNQVRTLRKRLEEGIEFTPGINILIGENGCGKSTVMNIIRSANRIEHSFIPTLDELKITTITELNELFDSFEVIGDYRLPVFNLYRMFEDKELVGSTGTVMDSFDNAKLFISGKEESKGQNVMGDINQLMDWMFNRSSECYPILHHINKLHEEGSWKEVSNFREENGTTTKLIKAFQRNSLKSGDIFTILMDEPDQGLDVGNLEEIYGMVSYDKPQTQLIAAIHNPVLIYKLSKLNYVNIIEMSKDYLNKVKQFIEG